MTRPPKKSETLEIRLPYEAKTAFMTRCQTEGRTASEALRGYIEGAISEGKAPKRRARGWPALAAALAGLALGAVAAPSLANPNAGSKADFEQLDRNRDGVLNFEEYRAR
jgi:hypothetical protein